VPSRKEIQWSQLKVGMLVLVATAVLVALIFLMTGASGGLFAHQVVLRCYFPNASGLKVGAPVTLEGVTIGNVAHMRIDQSHNPNPVEVVMRVSAVSLRDLHTDSTAQITTAGVLGDSFVDIDSKNATGPPPLNNGELQQSGAPTIQSVINTSQVSIEEINRLIRKIEVLTDTLNSSRGTVGELLNDPGMKKKVELIASDLQTITSNIAQGKGSLGQLINDNTLATKLNTTVDQLNTLTANLNAGKGTAGKFLNDETAFNNFNSAMSNLNQILASINAGNGAIGKMTKDPETAKKLTDLIANLDSILKNLNEGEGSAGQFLKNRSLYNHADQTLDQAQQLVKGMREDPKKYLVIQLKLF
jgi:phospholipid/cholesterol/gamma-HCH transport system substrate-binding protein